MSVAIKIDPFGVVQDPTIVLATRNGTKLGDMSAYNVVFNESLRSTKQIIGFGKICRILSLFGSRTMIFGLRCMFLWRRAAIPLKSLPLDPSEKLSYHKSMFTVWRSIQIMRLPKTAISRLSCLMTRSPKEACLTVF